ncbi:hypothetical protein HNQ71_007089 [Mesorhizobium sangaii]|uniref:Uncharacterized protein n=1 Tax=Mesorhizobium sangaii TaxID=505389 RepID=A0A841PVU4_9HYPH|nr:hypothetical protein [Mesorhizobium sangaii]
MSKPQQGMNSGARNLVPTRAGTSTTLLFEHYDRVLEDRLKLTLNMEKTHITHVDDGFVFLGHRIIRKLGSNGHMSVVTTISRKRPRRLFAN